MSGPIATESVDLERLRYEVRYRTDRRIIAQQASMSIDPVDYLSNQMVLRLEAYFLGRRAEEEFVTAYHVVPDGWWSHLLDAVARRIAGRLYPVGDMVARACLSRVRTVTLPKSTTVYRVCPHIDVMYGDRPHVHLCWLKGSGLSTIVDRSEGPGEEVPAP